MASKNPNPERISDAIWSIWTRFDALEPTALLGGILALKPGYHSYRSRLRSADYSVEDLAADRKGSSSKSSAIDLTMSAAAMVKYSKRLDAACRARDPRLFIDGQPIIREFIGTLNNRTVYCYVLVGGKQLGVGADHGPDPGRDKSHLWHIHISIIRQFCESQDAADRIVSVLEGESLDDWYDKHPALRPPEHVVVPKPPAKPPVKPAVHKPGSRVLQYVPGRPVMTGEDAAFVQAFIGPARAGRADGAFGARTKAATKWYQQMRGLKADGVVGPATWRAMSVKNSL